MSDRFEQKDVKPYFGRRLEICNMEFTLYDHHEPNMKPRIAWIHVIESGDLLIFATPYANSLIPLGVFVVYREDNKPIENEVKMGTGYYNTKIETITEYCEAVKIISEKVIRDYIDLIEMLHRELTVTNDGRAKFV